MPPRAMKSPAIIVYESAGPYISVKVTVRAAVPKPAAMTRGMATAARVINLASVEIDGVLGLLNDGLEH